IAIERHDADFHERIVLVRPRLREIEGIDAVSLRFGIRHDLHRQHPLRELLPLDRFEQIAAMVIGVEARHLLRFGIAEELHALAGMEVILHPEPLAAAVDPHERVRAVAVHVAPRARQPARPHEVRHLMRGFGIVRPEVPLHVVVAQSRVGKTLLTANEVRELHRIANEENRCVVADEIVVALRRMELEREAAHVALRVRAPHLAGDRREAPAHPTGSTRPSWSWPYRTTSQPRRTRPRPWRAAGVSALSLE